MDWDEVERLVVDGYISAQRHPIAPYTIYNYTHKAAYDRLWTPETTACRGLIVDDKRRIVARPFPKFFNYTEVPLPAFVHAAEPLVTEKMDGSLGIMYEAGPYAIATRGSFLSDQAMWATQWLDEDAPGWIAPPEGTTPLFEIIYPRNRIVVDYEGKAGLVLLAVIDNETGADLPLQAQEDWWGGPIAKQYQAPTVEEAYVLATGNEFERAEGVVLTWPRYNEPSFRLKIKHPEYIRLHRILTNVSNKTIWQHLKQGHNAREILENVPDEFYNWVRATEGALNKACQALYDETTSEFLELCFNKLPADTSMNPFEYWKTHRGEFAGAVAQSGTKNASNMFSLLDGKTDKVMSRCWDLVRPVYSKPFVNLDEEA